jgi:hypothetical protein
MPSEPEPTAAREPVAVASSATIVVVVLVSSESVLVDVIVERVV